MYALFFILNQVDKLDAVLGRFFDLGLGATVIDSVGMGKVLLDNNFDVPIFSSIRKLIEGSHPYNKTIVSVIRDNEKLESVKRMLEEELDYIDKNGVGFMFIVPVAECYGYGIGKKKA